MWRKWKIFPVFVLKFSNLKSTTPHEKVEEVTGFLNNKKKYNQIQIIISVIL
jgi:hypothetical protein